MEGLIPLVYKAIVQYKNGEINSWLNLNESPSSSYVRLPGDSGRFGFTTAAAAASPPSSAGNRRLVVNAGIQSPAGCHLNTRRAVK